MTKDEALRMAIECLEYHQEHNQIWGHDVEGTIAYCIEALVQLELQPESVVKDSLTVQKPLSDADLLDVFEECYGHDDMDYTQKYFARAIEQAHGIGE